MKSWLLINLLRNSMALLHSLPHNFSTFPGLFFFSTSKKLQLLKMSEATEASHEARVKIDILLWKHKSQCVKCTSFEPHVHSLPTL